MVSPSEIRYRLAVFASNDAILTAIGVVVALSAVFSSQQVLLAASVIAVIFSLSISGSAFSLLREYQSPKSTKKHARHHVLIEHKLGLAGEHRHPALYAATVIFAACILAWAILLVPFVFVDVSYAMFSSAVLGMLLLLLVGVLRGHIRNDRSHGLRQVVLGLLMGVCGYVLGLLLTAIF